MNEVKPGIPAVRLKEMLENKNLPEAASFNAKRILKHPPVEPVWITHGLVIAGLCRELGIEDDYEHFIPKFGEIRDIKIA